MANHERAANPTVLTREVLHVFAFTGDCARPEIAMVDSAEANATGVVNPEHVPGFMAEVTIFVDDRQADAPLLTGCRVQDLSHPSGATIAIATRSPQPLSALAVDHLLSNAEPIGPRAAPCAPTLSILGVSKLTHRI